MSLNIIRVSFLLQTLSAVVLSTLSNLGPKLSSRISKVYRYGKFHKQANKHELLKSFEVPKSYFKHIYTFAGPWSTFAVVLLCYRYIFNGALPVLVVSTLERFMGAPLQSLVPPENALLGITLFSIHCWKRYYESHHVSIYSDSKMNLIIYLASYYYYFASFASIVAESRDFIRDTQIDLHWTRLTWLEHSCAGLLLLSTYMQYRCNLILINLRKDKRANVATKGYKVPKGGLFNYVTAPLQLTEIIVYLCLNVILRDASTFYYVTLLVLANQIDYAYVSHKWSIKTFKDYPKNRKVIVPFIF